MRSATLQDDPGVGVVDLVNALWREKLVVLGVTTVFALASIAYSLALAPIFRSQAVLAPAAMNRASGTFSGLDSLASFAGVTLGSGGDSVQAIAMLRSNSFAEEFIVEQNLMPILFADEWDADRSRWLTEIDEPPDIRDGVRLFTEEVRYVTQDRETGLVTLAIEWPEPAIAAEWATEMAQKINERIRQRDMREFEAKLDYLNRQLAEASLVELRQAIARVIEDQINAMMLARSQPEYAFKIIDAPVIPKERVSPQRTLIVIIGTFVGGVVAVLLALLRNAIRNRRRSTPTD